MAESTIEEVDVHLRNIINSLYLLIMSIHDYQGAETLKSVTTEIKHLINLLVTTSRTARRLPTFIPVEIIGYVESTRNPDIYTRDFVELVMRYNQSLAGQSAGLAQFRDIFGKEIMSAIPELSQDVSEILVATGGAKVES
ncbi:hypothetical protein KC343_g11739 [Hortaea werneckii]|uniref:Mediator of RNA polymerase II transcription subunit 10 n=1 Tax=Hortaea werneckii TaxID=91943 RepID=A0A3M7D5J9_HORWE|nr:hypothetical protein KC352_g21592 [Hortaea werneckii]KAI7557012.1 hypothetical protein KC317_g11892 [Hortaea werneckii]KAI7604123.1 hypothetical protein KC346_g11604 [Hortaea werneckii]KAI7610933.1 hypothetical protein KC343_g11739 [Hortaea werneckii]KAI7648199.1 hypothetical protein KC319_g11478 [Hortaea werneckii]